MKTLKYAAILVALVVMVGCGDSSVDAPVIPSSFHIDRDALMGDVGGGNHFYSTHWERYTDDRTGQTIICFSSNNGAGGTSLNSSCVTEVKP